MIESGVVAGKAEAVWSQAAAASRRVGVIDNMLLDDSRVERTREAARGLERAVEDGSTTAKYRLVIYPTKVATRPPRGLACGQKGILCDLSSSSTVTVKM